MIRHNGKTRINSLKDVGSKQRQKIILDSNFISNHFQPNTPFDFRLLHTKQFLELLHPLYSFSSGVLHDLNENRTNVKTESKYYQEKLDLYYSVCKVALHHILIAPQKVCVLCGSISKPVLSAVRNIVVYVSLTKEPQPGSLISSRCIDHKNCGHRGKYGWDVVPCDTNSLKIFQPFPDRHTLPY